MTSGRRLIDQVVWLSAMAVSLAALTMVSSQATGQTLDRVVQHATDSHFHHPFLSNPAGISVKSPWQGSVGIGRVSGQAEATEIENDGEQIKTTTDQQEDYLGASFLTDIGAGAAVGFNYQKMFRDMDVRSSEEEDPLKEQVASQYFAVQFIISLTESLVFGLEVRNLHQEVMVIGNFNLPQDQPTRYRSTLFGYGLGATYRFEKAAIGIVSLPPLRGKSDVFGEEFIWREPGQIDIGAHFDVAAETRLGVTYVRHIHRRDDLAEGTTRNDQNGTSVSLDGLGFDRFVFPDKTIMIGVDQSIAPKVAARLTLMQEESVFIFNTEDVPGDEDEAPRLKSYRVRAAAHFDQDGLALQGGIGLFQKDHENRGESGNFDYQAAGQELYILVSKSF